MILLLGCYSLDGFFFSPVAVDAYALGGDVIPADCQELVDFEGDAGSLYGAWGHQPEDGEASCAPGTPNADADVLLFFHGNAENIDHYWTDVEFYWQSGFEVFVFDYRGYGRSAGDPSHDGVIADGAAAIHYVEESTGLESTEMVFVGLSLGGFVSIHNIDKRPPRAFVTEDMFASAQTLLDQGTLLDLPQGWLFVETFDNLAAARKMPPEVPYLVVHGEKDDYIQPENARLVYEAAASDNKYLFLVPGMDHAETITEAPDVFRPWLECWAEQTCAID
ncbi:MAG: alpha/beta hydrolase [Deltaproteobacteria bacterium]|nr:alpha/beta hydrolase [Deltaproteobacteria bacterium]